MSPRLRRWRNGCRSPPPNPRALHSEPRSPTPHPMTACWRRMPSRRRQAASPSQANTLRNTSEDHSCCVSFRKFFRGTIHNPSQACVPVHCTKRTALGLLLKHNSEASCRYSLSESWITDREATHQQCIYRPRARGAPCAGTHRANNFPWPATDSREKHSGACGPSR